MAAGERAGAVDDPFVRILVEGDAERRLFRDADAEAPGLVRVGEEARVRDGGDVDEPAAVPDEFGDGESEGDGSGELVESFAEVIEGSQGGAAEVGGFCGAGVVGRGGGIGEDFPIESGEGESAGGLDGGEAWPALEHFLEQLELELGGAGIGGVEEGEHARRRETDAGVGMGVVLAPGPHEAFGVGDFWFSETEEGAEFFDGVFDDGIANFIEHVFDSIAVGGPAGSRGGPDVQRAGRQVRPTGSRIAHFY